jgi:hypothetical protein
VNNAGGQGGNNNAGGQGGNNAGGGFAMPLLIVPVVPVGIGPTRPQHLTPGPDAYLQGLMADFKNRLTAATHRLAHENLLFLAAVMQLWGDNLQTPVIPVHNLTTELARCNWLYDRCFANNARWPVNVDGYVSGPLQLRWNNNTLDIEAFNPAFDFVYNLAFQANL